LNGQQALSRLIEGNERFAAGEPEAPRRGPDRRAEITGGQDPFAVVLTCSDSRVPPEILFDQGLGDIFTVRVAGNVIDDLVVGSIEYAVAHLGVPLLVVLGHSCCGAVKATMAGGEAEGHTGSFIGEIGRRIAGCSCCEDAEKTVVREMMKALSASMPVIAPLVENGKLLVKGAYYDLETGKVEVI
jgi:carbonic anhydrase